MKKNEHELAVKVMNQGVYQSTSGNSVWRHDWYNFNGCLVRVSYKNGKLAECQNYGR